MLIEFLNPYMYNIIKLCRCILKLKINFKTMNLLRNKTLGKYYKKIYYITWLLNILLTKINSPSLQKWNIFEARFSRLVTKNVSI